MRQDTPDRLPGSGLRALAVRGGEIAEKETGRRMMLRGVNRSGLEYAEPGEIGFLAAAGMNEREMDTLCREWGCGVLRIPFNQDFVLHGRGSWSATSYVDALDQVAAWAEERGTYTILDLQWLDAVREWGAGNRVPPKPEAESLDAWRVLARRFRERASVLFDLFNEPHDLAAAEWNHWAQAMLEVVRAEGFAGLVFVSGVEWGYDLRGVHVEGQDVVYSTHVYRERGEDWEACFGERARTEAVFAAEWGGYAQDLGWGTRLADYFEELGMGWTAWSWADRPRLQVRGAPTGFGQIVKDRLKSSS